MLDGLLAIDCSLRLTGVALMSDGAVVASLPIYLEEGSDPPFFEAFIIYFLKIWL